MVGYFDAADFGQFELGVVFDQFETAVILRIRKRIIPTLATETRESRLIACFNATEKRLVGFIESPCDILECLGIHRVKGVVFDGQFWYFLDLGEARNGFASLFPIIFPLSQKIIVNTTAGIQCLKHCLLLLLCRVDAVFEGFHFLGHLFLRASASRWLRRCRSSAVRVLGIPLPFLPMMLAAFCN